MLHWLPSILKLKVEYFYNINIQNLSSSLSLWRHSYPYLENKLIVFVQRLSDYYINWNNLITRSTSGRRAEKVLLGLAEWIAETRKIDINYLNSLSVNMVNVIYVNF